MASQKDKKSGSQTVFTAALNHVSEYVASLYSEQHDRRLFFHSYEYCRQLALITRSAATELKFDAETADEAELIAWFFQAGRLFNYNNFKPESHRLLREYLLAHDVAVTSIPELPIFLLEDKGNIRNHLLVDVLKDSQIILRYGLLENLPDFLLKSELEAEVSKEYLKEEWDLLTFKEMEGCKFQTSWATSHFGHLFNLKLASLKASVSIGQPPSVLPVSAKSKKGGRSASLAAYNFFRISFRNHIELSAMADNRSHIMISVNSIMMGILISFITYQNLADTNPRLLFPFVVFIITGMTSLIFAIMAAKPRMWRNINKGSDEFEILTHLSSYSNFALLEIDQYEESLDIVLDDPKLVRINLKKELYYLGKILEIKNRYLVFSYNIFMFGFLVSMVLFLAILIWV